MEYIPGGDLMSMLIKEERFSEDLARSAKSVFKRICQQKCFILIYQSWFESLTKYLKQQSYSYGDI
jgi:hypothetical protein